MYIYKYQKPRNEPGLNVEHSCCNTLTSKVKQNYKMSVGTTVGCKTRTSAKR